MSSKIISVFCAKALLVVLTFTKCPGLDAYSPKYGLITPGLADTGIAFTNPCYSYPFSIEGTVTSGGNLPVNSFSAIPPSGVFVTSENLYEGVLATAGELPFVGTVGVDSVLLAAGAGAVNYGCGNGDTVMVSETAPATASLSPTVTSLYPTVTSLFSTASSLSPTAAIGAFVPAIGFGPTATASPAFSFNTGWTRTRCSCAF